MELTLETFLVICPLVFLAGVVDAVGGGGGLISLPAYLIAGVPTHFAIATNKLSSSCGTALTTIRFIRNKLVDFKLAIPGVIAAMIGSALGARLSLFISEKILSYLLMGVLPLAALLVMNKKLFSDRPDAPDSYHFHQHVILFISAFCIGVYDGLYGPGTGTFLIIAFTVFGRLPVRKSNGQAKIINLTTNVTALAVFLLHGQVLLLLGAVAAICNMAGGYLGAGLAMRKNVAFIRLSILFVFILLAVRLYLS